MPGWALLRAASMSSAGPFPFPFPSDARRAFGSDEAALRFATAAQLQPDARVLMLGCGPGNTGLVLVRERGATLVAADPEASALDALRELARLEGLEMRLQTRRVDLTQLPFEEGSFDAVWVPGRVPFRLEDALRRLRPLLAPRGRLGLTYPARVGRQVRREAIESWQTRLGEALRSPRDLLMVLEQAGFEPESAEALSDRELDAVYNDLEHSLEGASAEVAATLRAEAAAHRAHAGAPACVTYAFLTGRRREPGEKPPVARDRG